jgi:ADP-heptose:LPS heptosyltransferase
MPKPHKIIVIQFKYLGDAVLLTPALFALKQKYPQSKIHLLIPQEFTSVFEHQKNIDHIIGLPRTRGSMNFMKLWPYVSKLRNEKFDISIDVAGNDRGALLSLLIGANKRFSVVNGESNFIKKIGYSKILKAENFSGNWVLRHLNFLNQILDVPIPNKPKLSVIAEKSLSFDAKKILKKFDIICHIGTSQLKKEWPISKWAELNKFAKKHGYQLAFSSGTNDREYALLEQLKKLDPDIFLLPKIENLRFFIAMLNQAKLVISCDTGPLHIASGLGIDVIALYAVDDGVRNYSKIYTKDELILGSTCKCIGQLAHFSVCQNEYTCMNSITVKSVFNLLVKKYSKKK